jgi:hypothetical protein
VNADEINVACQRSAGGWQCRVWVGGDASATSHEVSLTQEDMRRLAPQSTPEELVRQSFRFLLEREPRTSIMRRFELPLISRFFAEYEEEIGRRMGQRGQ